jgi:hypothetical protein
MLIVAACGGGTSATTTSVSVPDYGRAASEFAASAERALESTVFEALGVEVVADVVAGLCDGLGIGAVEATVDGLVDDPAAADRAIMVEVLESGVRQVCPDRSALDFTPIYVDSISSVLADVGIGGFDEGRAIRAAPDVCDAFVGGADAEVALLRVVEHMFDVSVDAIEDLDGAIDADQGFVAGTILATATALLCPEFAPEVTGLNPSP